MIKARSRGRLGAGLGADESLHATGADARPGVHVLTARTKPGQVPRMLRSFRPLPHEAGPGAGALARIMGLFDHDNVQMVSASAAAEMNAMGQNSPAEALLMLDKGERVELGFKRKKDLVLFTNLRCVSLWTFDIDRKCACLIDHPLKLL